MQSRSEKLIHSLDLPMKKALSDIIAEEKKTNRLLKAKGDNEFLNRICDIIEKYNKERGDFKKWFLKKWKLKILDHFI